MLLCAVVAFYTLKIIFSHDFIDPRHKFLNIRINSWHCNKQTNKQTDGKVIISHERLMKFMKIFALLTMLSATADA